MGNSDLFKGLKSRLILGIVVAAIIFVVYSLITPFRLRSDESKKVDQERRSLPDEKSAGPDQDTVELPFLGELKVRSITRAIKVKQSDRSAFEMNFKVSVLEDGRFISAEYNREEVPAYYRLPMKDLETDYRGLDEEITGIPSENGGKTLDVVLEHLQETSDLTLASRVQINYVMLRGAMSRQDDRPVFIANVYGVKTMEFSVPVQGEAAKRVRYVFSKDGELLYVDNLL